MKAFRKNFNKKAKYDEHIKEKMEEVKKLLEEHEIPYFFTACIANSENGTEYKSEVLSPESLGFSVEENHMEDHINILNGFTTTQRKMEDIYDWN